MTSFDKFFDVTAGVYINFYNIYIFKFMLSMADLLTFDFSPDAATRARPCSTDSSETATETGTPISPGRRDSSSFARSS